MIDFEQLISDLHKVPQVDGIVPVDILNLPQPVGKIVRGMVRDKRITAVELGEALELPTEQASVVATILVDKGYLYIVEEESNELAEYKIRFARMRKQNIPIDL